MKIISGIQPSGKIHLGNYFGMIKPLLSFKDSEVLCFLASYHSMTSLFDAKERKANKLELAATLLACGLDPNQITLFDQADVPEVTELAYILSTVVNTSVLERCHSYKDKKSKGLPANVGLFTYPILMAADILIYDADVVPVGKDQLQHLEVTCDIAGYFNSVYGKIFNLPKAFVKEESIVPGIDALKMSKSYNNTIQLFGDSNLIRKKIMSITMDSRDINEPKPDAANNTAIILLKLLNNEVGLDIEKQLSNGGLGYGKLKQILFEEHNKYFGEKNKVYNDLIKNTDYINLVLKNGSEKAREIASKKIKQVKEVIGL